MKYLLLTTIAAVLVVGCGPSKAELALIQAAKDGNIKATKQAIADGADVNAEDPFKGLRRTPLHRAAYYGHKEIVVLLIAKGADVNVKNDVGYTPLDWNHPDTAALLRKHGGKTGEELKAEGK